MSQNFRRNIRSPSCRTFFSSFRAPGLGSRIRDAARTTSAHARLYLYRSPVIFHLILHHGLFSRCEAPIPDHDCEEPRRATQTSALRPAPAPRALRLAATPRRQFPAGRLVVIRPGRRPGRDRGWCWQPEKEAAAQAKSEEAGGRAVRGRWCGNSGDRCAEGRGRYAPCRRSG